MVLVEVVSGFIGGLRVFTVHPGVGVADVSGFRDE